MRGRRGLSLPDVEGQMIPMTYVRCAICGRDVSVLSVHDGMCLLCTHDELQRIRKERNEFKARLDGMKLNAQIGPVVKVASYTENE